MKWKARLSMGKSKEVVVESNDDSEGPGLLETKKWKLATRKSKTGESVVEAVVSYVQQVWFLFFYLVFNK
jgi:hypothetical protein